VKLHHPTSSSSSSPIAVCLTAMVFLWMSVTSAFASGSGLPQSTVLSTSPTAACAADQSMAWGAAKDAAKSTLYSVWNIASVGFLKRQDERREKYDRGEISEEDFDRGTFIDAGVSIAASVAGGGVGNKVTAATAGLAARGSVGAATSAAASGAAMAGVTNATEQAGQVITHQVTGGRLGRASIDPTEIAIHTAGGAVLGAGIHAATPYVAKAVTAAETAVKSGVSSVKARITGESEKLGVDVAQTMSSRSVPAVASVAEEQAARAATRVEAGAPVSAVDNVASAVNPRLTQRLEAFRSYRANGG
jgi:hypothetical protein